MTKIIYPLFVLIISFLFALSFNSAAHARQITGVFNYGEALQKSIFFYDIQRLGKLSNVTGELANRAYWRGDSFLQDYALPNQEGTIDLGGGFADAGDNVKFNLPMSAATTILAFSVVEFRKAFEESNQITPMLANLRWATDYLLKCWDAPNKRLYGQVSPVSVQAEHSNLWMPYEVIDQASVDKSLPRYGFYVDPTHPGTDLAADNVAALTAASLAFNATDPTYASKLLAAAKNIYQTLVDVPVKGKYSDNMGRNVGGSWQKADVSAFYNSWSGYADEVAWAAIWLYRATADASYLPIAKSVPFGNTAATLSWDDKSYGTYLLLAKFLPDSDPVKATAKASADAWLDSWSQGTNGHTFSKDGLAIANALAPWGNARYAATTAFGALVYDSYFATTKYQQFAKNQIDYLLGNNSKGFSYMEGYGSLFPRHSHHATAEGRWDGNNDVGLPDENRHIAYGALVGGPKDVNDTYVDDRGDFIGNEVALDYNAGLVGALAALYTQFGGTPLPIDQFPPTRASEKPPVNEFFVNGVVQSGNIQPNQSTVQVGLLATNHSAWPARVTNNLKLKYFLNLADKPANGTVKISTFSTDPRAVVSDLKLYDSSKQIYVVEVWFKDIPIYPGGDDRVISSKETQLQFQFSWAHDYTKDWSYQGIGSQNNPKVSPNIPIYEVVGGADKLLYGAEPANQPQGALTINFATTIPVDCIGAKDVLLINQAPGPTLTVGNSPFIQMLPVGGPYLVSLSSTANPIVVSSGTCKGMLNVSSITVPGSLIANYTFTKTPPVDMGSIHVSVAPTSDTRCLNAADTLFIDQDTVGEQFLVANAGISKLVKTGVHQIRTTSQTSIPAPNNQAGICKSTLDKTSLNVTKDQTTTAIATYQFQSNSGDMSCTIVDSKVTQQADWGPQYGIVSTWQIKVTFAGLPKDGDGKTLLKGSFIMKNDFVQNFWGNFNITSSSIDHATGTFNGEAYMNQLPLMLSGFIYNKNPLHVGDNPLQSMILNGIVCK